MVETDDLADKVFSLLKGNGYKIKIFDENGAEIVDPSQGRRFFVMSPNIMVTIDDDGDKRSLTLSKGKSVKEEDTAKLQHNISKLADEFMINKSIKVFGKSIEPRDYAYQVKKQKEQAMNENVNVNSHLMGQIVHLLTSTGAQLEAQGLVDKIKGSNIVDMQKALNKLVQDGKIVADASSGVPTYSIAIDEAVFETMETPGYIKYEQMKDKIAGVLTKLYDQGKDPETIKQLGDRVALHLGYDPADPTYQDAWITSFTDASLEGAFDEPDKDDYTDYTMRQGEMGRKGFMYEGKDTEKSAKTTNKRVEPKNPPPAVKKKPVTPFKSIKENFSKMFGSMKTSQQTLENVRILVKHKTPVDENVRGSRSKHISSIFLECNGERLRFSHNYLPGARAMAQHMAHGGSMNDKIGAYINESTGNLLKLQSFNRYVTTNKLINEDSTGIIDTVKENILSIREELKKLTGTKTYETVRARLETFERVPLSEDDTTQLKELFTIRRFDERFEQVLPIVQQLVHEKDTYHKRIEEAAMNPIVVRRESLSTTPIFEFSGEHSRLGFKINEFALRIMENDELAGFINKIGTKLCKECTVNKFEHAILSQVFENIKVLSEIETSTKEIKESLGLEAYFNKFVLSY